MQNTPLASRGDAMVKTGKARKDQVSTSQLRNNLASRTTYKRRVVVSSGRMLVAAAIFRGRPRGGMCLKGRSAKVLAAYKLGAQGTLPYIDGIRQRQPVSAPDESSALRRWVSSESPLANHSWCPPPLQRLWIPGTNPWTVEARKGGNAAINGCRFFGTNRVSLFPRLQVGAFCPILYDEIHISYQVSTSPNTTLHAFSRVLPYLCTYVPSFVMLHIFIPDVRSNTP